MKWSEEPYVRLYTRRTPNWMALPWQARCIFALLLRDADRSGQIDMGGHGMLGLSRLLDVPVAIVKAGVTALVTAGVCSQNGTVLTFPNYVDAQESRRARTDAERAAAYRARKNAGKPEESAGRSEHPKPTRVTNVTDASRLVPSALPSSAVPSSAVGGVGGRPEATSSKKRSRGPKRTPAPPPARGETLPEEWTPSVELIDELRQELGVDPMGSVPRFVDHHRQATGRSARSRDWSAKFRNWVRKDATDGKLDSLKPHRTMSEAVPSTNDEAPAIDASPEERKALADRVRGALDLPKTGTHET